MLNGTFEAPTPTVEPAVDARLAEPIATFLDEAAGELLVSGDNEDDPRPDRFEGGGPFATLSRPDRLRAMGRFDDEEDERVITQVLCAYTVLLYYSEWDGYDEFDRPPGDREFTVSVTGGASFSPTRCSSTRSSFEPGRPAGSPSQLATPPRWSPCSRVSALKSGLCGRLTGMCAKIPRTSAKMVA